MGPLLGTPVAGTWVGIGPFWTPSETPFWGSIFRPYFGQVPGPFLGPFLAVTGLIFRCTFRPFRTV